MNGSARLRWVRLRMSVRGSTRSTGRWPDLRIGGQRRGPLAPIDSGIAGTWCYGEAGIALTRLRAVAVLGPGPHRGDAEIAVESTRRHVADALPYAIDDLSLCHGLGGAADVLLDAAAAFDDRWHEGAHVVTELGHVTLERMPMQADRGHAARMVKRRRDCFSASAESAGCSYDYTIRRHPRHSRQSDLDNACPLDVA